jgi:PAS domain-containing protein
MTSYGSEQIAVDALKSGALDYVVKSPESFAAMPRTVARVLREWDLIHERRKAEEGRRLLATAVAQVGEALIITDSAGAVRYVNRAFETITGYREDEALGRNVEALEPLHVARR